MKRVGKRLLSWLMVVAMVLSVIHISAPMKVHAEEMHGITLGVPSWKSEHSTYSFPNVTVNMTDGADKQKVFCISVSDGGYFEVNLSGIYDSLDISGVRDNGKYADNSGADPTKVAQLSKTDKEKLISVTVLGDITDDEIKSFIKNLVFYRNGVALDKAQKVSVVSSSYDVRNDGGTALAIDGKLHVYKYIDWELDQEQNYNSKTNITTVIPKSEVANDSTQWTWFKAYELAKKQRLDGLKGYLATITSDEEQMFIFNKFGALSTTTSTKNGAWIGGARTYAALSTDASEKSSVAADVIFDADTMPNLYPTYYGYEYYYNYNYYYNAGNRAKVWRWMCGPESQTEKDRAFFTLDGTNQYEYAGTTNTYAKWNPGWSEQSKEPNNCASNKYQQEFCLQYGYVSDGGWNDWGPEHSPQSKENRSTTGSQEYSSDSAPGGFIVEFSSYDINKNGKEDEGEVPTIPAEEDYTIITAEPHIVSAKLDKETFKVNKPITVTSVIGDYTANAEGKPNDELITENKVPAYQWEYFDEDTNTWKNAIGEGNTTQTYTPVLEDIGKKLRVHISPSNNVTNNPHHYVGDLYLDATGSDDHTDKIKGTPVGYDEATVSGNDFMVAKKDLPTITSDKVIDYSKAEAEVDDLSVAVKPVADGELAALKSADTGDSVEITLVNKMFDDVTEKVKATVYDNVTTPAIDDKGKISQIGSNDFTVLRGSDPLTKDDVIKYGNVTVLTDGKEVKGNYTISKEDMDKLNDAVKNGPDNTVVPVKVKDEITGLETTVNVTIKANNILELESAKLTPFKDEDENGKLKHYHAGDTITVDEIKLAGIDVPITGKQLTDDFDYQWQYWSGNGAKDWQDIPGATAITLSAEDTTNYAKNKVQVVITPKDSTKYNTTNVKKLYVDGSSSSKENGDGSDHTTAGTYIDIFTIDANDFVISLEDAKAINNSKAAKAAGVETEISNNSVGGTKAVETTPSSNVKDANGLSKVKEASDVPVKFNATTTVDGNKLKARDKDSYGTIGKTVTAYVKDSAKTKTLDDGSKIGVGANDITITVNEAKEILSGDITSQSSKLSVKADCVVVDKDKTIKSDTLKYNQGNGSLVVSYDSGSTFKAEPGTYPVTYTYTDTNGKTVNTVANVTVVSKAEIKATDFIISVEDAGKVSEDDVEKKANATAKDDDGNNVDNDKIDVVDTDMSTLKATDKPGDVPLVINNTGATPNPTITIQAHVVDKTGTDEAAKITIGANHFEIYPEDVQKALDGDTDILKSFADAIAMDNGSDVPADKIKVTDAYKTDLKTTPGTYPVTFTYTNADNKTITVTVNATVKVPSVDAHDFIISTKDAKTVTGDIVKDKTDASGVDGDMNPVDEDKIVVDDISIDAIKDAGENGTPKDVQVKVTNTDKAPYPSKTVTAHVVDEQQDNKDTQPDKAKQISIGANNFELTAKEAQNAIAGDDAILRKLSEVIALDGYKNVDTSKIVVSDKSKLKAESGTYPVTFSYTNASGDTVTVTVDATVKVTSVDAHDFIITTDDAKTVTEDIVKDKSGASGLDGDSKPIAKDKIDVDDGSIDAIKAAGDKNEPKDISVKVTNTDKDPYPSKTVTAHVVDKQKDNKDKETDPAKQISIGADNFDITVKEAQSAIAGDDAILKKLSHVVALDGGKTVDTSKIAVGDKSKLKAESGTYPVTFSYTNASGENVNVTVDATVLVSTVDAHDFIISTDDARNVTKDIVKDKTEASGLDKDSKPVGKDKIAIDDASIDAIKDAGDNETPKDISVKVTNNDKAPYPSKTVTAHVVDKTGEDETAKITIGANHFEIYPEDVQKALDGDTDILKKFAGAIAMDNGSDVPADKIKVTDAYETDLKTIPGTYPVTFTYTNADNKIVTVTVNATVKVPSVDAHDFIISTDDAKTVTKKIVKEKSGASGFDGDSKPVDDSKIDIDNKSIVDIKDAGDKGTPKDIAVKVSNTDKEPYPSKTVTAHVVDETKDNKETEKNPDKQITIGANNFEISPEDADKAKGASGDDEILKKLSEVIAIEGYKDVPASSISVTDKAKLDSQPGDYPITFAYKGVDVTVIATVKAPEESKADIDAHDIIISVNDAQNLTEDEIKKDSDAAGKDPSDKPIDSSKIDVKDEDVDSIKNTTTPGMIPVELKNTSTDPNSTKKINAYIVDEQNDNKNDEKDPAKQISIGANNFGISVEDAQKAIDGEDTILRQLSAVVALDGGKNVNTSDIVVSDKTALKAEPGKYPVTFSYTNASDETVTVTVDAIVKANNGSKDATDKDDNNKDNGDGEEITGNDFTVAGGGDPLTPKDIIDKGNVDAVDGNGTPIVLPPDSSVNPEDLGKLNDAIKDGKKGTYPVKVTTPNGTPVTVNVTVTDKSDDKKEDDVPTDETIAANNFKIGINDYDKVFNPDEKDGNVKKLSNALAYDTDLKTPIEITKIDTSAVAKEPGTYPVTLATDKGTRTTIMVTVDKEWDTIGDIDQAADANKNGETTDNVTAKKIDPIGVQEPVPTATGGKTENIKPEDITYEKTNPQDKTEPIDPNKKIAASNALKINGENVPDNMYSVSADGTKLIISRDYLATLEKGTYPAVLTYADGTVQNFKVSIVDYDETTVVKNPPLFSMYKEIVLKKKNTFTVNLKGISDYAIVSSKITGKGKKAKKVVAIKQQKNGDVLITPKKTGKTQVTCTIIQNGAEYKVVVDIKVLKQYKGTSKNYNLKTKGLVKTSGELPEFNVYKRIVKGKNTKIKFTKVATDAKVKFYVANKKEAKSLKIGKVKRKGKTATCTIVGKKKGWVHLTAEITQNGKTYYTRLLVRIDDGSWSKKQLNKYLK